MQIFHVAHLPEFWTGLVGTSEYQWVPNEYQWVPVQWVPVGTIAVGTRSTKKTKTKSAVLPKSLMSFFG